MFKQESWFKSNLFRTDSKKEGDGYKWMLDSFHGTKNLKLDSSSNSSDCDGKEEDSDEDSVDLMAEKKIYTNEHKHHSEAHHEFRWSMKPDSRISCGINTMKAKKPAAPKMKMKTVGTMMMSMRNDDVYLTSDDEDLFLDEDMPISQSEEAPQKEEIMHTEEVIAPKKKKKKNKKKSDSSICTSRLSVGSKKSKKKVGKKGKKKLGEDSEELKVKKKKKKKKKKGSEELKVSEPKKQRVSLKDRIRASLAMIGDRGGSLSKNTLDQLRVDMSVIQEASEEETTTSAEEVSSFLVEERKEAEAEPSSKEEVEKPTEAPATPKVAKLAVLLKGGCPGSPNVPASPLLQFREAGHKMRAILKVRQSVVDSTFAAAFSSQQDEAVNAGLMSKSDRATVDKMLADLQQYESQLQQERNQLAEDREMMILQQESVEQLLETENETTRQLEARVLELENMLENEVCRQENEELMMKVQMLEMEVERQEATLANMATEQQQVLKAHASLGTASISSFNTSDSDPDYWIVDSSGSEEEDPDENDYGGASRPIPNAAKLQGELLQLRSSLNHKDTALEEQAKEITRLRERLQQSQRAQRLSQVEATCEDYRNENRQLKQELAKAEVVVERLKQSNAEKAQALKKAEEEKDDTLRKLETHHPLNMNTTIKPRQSTINKVLDIGAPAQFVTTTPTETTDTITEEAEQIEEGDESDPNQAVQVPEKRNSWFGFGGGDSGSDSNEEGVVKEEESSGGWFGFAGKNEEEEVVKEDEGSGWFGFGQKEKEDDSQVEGKDGLDALLNF